MIRFITNNLFIPQYNNQTNSGIIVIDKSQNELFDYAWHKNKTKYFHATLEDVFMPRTLGKRSQNHRINGHIQFICMETGCDFDALKLYLKNKAIGRGYPYDTIKNQVFPRSEAKISIDEAKFLIDEIMQFAAENNIILPEYE